MIVFRAFSGIAASFSLPSAVSLINDVFPPGKSRNVAFSTMGGSQPVGFGLGLTLGGVVTGTIGWKWGFFIGAITNVIMLAVATWQLPKNVPNTTNDMWRRLGSDIDWVGVVVASISLALLSYSIA
jgi:MFS family permease